MTRHMGFLLIDGFSLLSFASTVEPLRAANTLAGKALYSWDNLSIDGMQTFASSGLPIRPDRMLGDTSTYDTVFVCAAGNPIVFQNMPTLRWLRGLATQGVRLAGVSAGPFVLARAGLLDDVRCTLHWEHIPAFREAFPYLDLTRKLFEIDRDRLTCGGGVAALDMMHALIKIDHGPALASMVSDWFLQTQIRLGENDQRLSPRERYGTSSPRLIAALTRMEQRLEQPVSRGELASLAGVSLRQLERLFAVHLSTSIEKHYQRMRLDRGRLLLRQSTLSVVEISIACGFVSASHFSRSYKAAFGNSPNHERPDRRSKQPCKFPVLQP